MKLSKDSDGLHIVITKLENNKRKHFNNYLEDQKEKIPVIS
jgi:hypothetical protein